MAFTKSKGQVSSCSYIRYKKRGLGQASLSQLALLGFAAMSDTASVNLSLSPIAERLTREFSLTRSIKWTTFVNHLYAKADFPISLSKID